MRNMTILGFASIAALAISVSPVTLAQTSEAGAASPTAPDEALAEVIVTAEKRAERLQDVPIAEIGRAHV